MFDIVWLGIVATVGSVLAGILAWAKTEPPEPFSGRKFAITLVASIIAGFGVAVAFCQQGCDASPLTLIIAALAGAGFDTGIENGIKAISRKVK